MNKGKSTPEDFAPALARAFTDRFDGLRIETGWNIISMRHVTMPVEGSDWEFEPEHIAFIAGFEAGWLMKA